jgi:hypothetical protein
VTGVKEQHKSEVVSLFIFGTIAITTIATVIATATVVTITAFLDYSCT